MNFKAVVIGLGNIGFQYDLKIDKANHFYSHVKSFNHHPNCEVIAGIDTLPSNRELFEKETGKHAYQAIEFLQEQVDIFVIATPTENHLEVFKECVKRSPKLIVLEKPIANSREEAEQIINLATKSNIPVFVNYIRRTEPSNLIIRNMIFSKELGELREINIQYNRGLLNNASHFIDLCSYFLGEPSEIKRESEVISIHQEISNDYQIDFNCKFGAATSHFKSHHYHNKNNSLQQYIFDKNQIEISSEDNRVYIKDKNGEILSEIENQYYRYQYNVTEHLINHLLTNRPLVSDLITAKQTLDICLKLLAQ